MHICLLLCEAEILPQTTNPVSKRKLGATKAVFQMASLPTGQHDSYGQGVGMKSLYIHIAPDSVDSLFLGLLSHHQLTFYTAGFLKVCSVEP